MTRALLFYLAAVFLLVGSVSCDLNTYELRKTGDAAEMCILAGLSRAQNCNSVPADQRTQCTNLEQALIPICIVVTSDYLQEQ